MKNRRTLVFILLSIFMGIGAAIEEVAAHRYGMSVAALVFFLIVVPWFGWNYIKPQE